MMVFSVGPANRDLLILYTDRIGSPGVQPLEGNNIGTVHPDKVFIWQDIFQFFQCLPCDQPAIIGMNKGIVF